jgi:Dullard-like phosphatase family protein
MQEVSTLDQDSFSYHDTDEHDSDSDTLETKLTGDTAYLVKGSFGTTVRQGCQSLTHPMVRLNSPRVQKVFSFGDSSSFEETQTQPPAEAEEGIRPMLHYVLNTQSNEKVFTKGRSPQSRVLRPVASKHPENAPRVSRPELSAVVTSVKPGGEEKETLYKEHLYQTFQAMRLISSLPGSDEAQIRQKMQYLPKRAGYQHKKTVVFDLDETLVHCCPNAEEAQVAITVNFPGGERAKAGINIRPYARDVLKAANEDYEVIVFTASHKCYADEVLDYLDPTGSLIHHRLYRENCLLIDSVYIKDLRVLGNRRLQDIVIVDNAAYSFAYQLDNGIPIISWYADPTDSELNSLAQYLKVLAVVDDIRTLNRQTFHLHTFYEDYMHDFLSRGKENYR